MHAINTFIDRTIRWFLIVFGLLTCATLPIAFDIHAITLLFGGFVDHTSSSMPLIRHWGLMVFGIGALMIVAAFRPWLRFEAMLFSALEKSLVVYLFLTNLDEPWIMGYFSAFLMDATIVAYSIVYFISHRGRPRRWVEIDSKPIE